MNKWPFCIRSSQAAHREPYHRAVCLPKWVLDDPDLHCKPAAVVVGAMPLTMPFSQLICSKNFCC